MTTFHRATDVDATAEELFAYHARPGALARLTPPWERVQVVQQDPPTSIGARAVVRTSLIGPISTTIVADIVEVARPGGFVDEQVQGPFSSWRHRHAFADARIEDTIDFVAPGLAIGHSVVEHRLARLFRFRHTTTAADLALARALPAPAGLVVAVSGAGGLIGAEFCALAGQLGARVLRIVRRAPVADDEIGWDVATGEVDARDHRPSVVVHLAGENLGDGRLDDQKKRRVVEGRGAATARLVDRLARLPVPPRAFVSASGVGFFGDRGAEPLDDDAAAGDGFLAEVCRAWEAAAASGDAHGMRTASARFGVVLSPRGGALARMLPPFLAGVGGRLGDGKQGFPVLSVDDAAAILWRAVVDERVRGPFNASLPTPSNAAFTAALGRVLRRPAVVPVPAAALRVALGPLADLGPLASAFVQPRRLVDWGHAFRHPDAESALRHVLGR